MARRFAGPRRLWHACAVCAALLLATGATVDARVLLTRDQALELAFGRGARVERLSVFLTDDQLARARELAGRDVELNGALVVQYVGRVDGKIVGTAYFDTHRVRTLQETLMVVVGQNERVVRLEILSFQEPQEYLPREGWLGQFDDRALDEELRVRRGVHGITGATLSARAVTDATRRVLAIHRAIVDGKAGGATTGGAE